MIKSRKKLNHHVAVKTVNWPTFWLFFTQVAEKNRNILKDKVYLRGFFSSYNKKKCCVIFRHVFIFLNFKPLDTCWRPPGREFSKMLGPFVTSQWVLFHNCVFQHTISERWAKPKKKSFFPHFEFGDADRPLFRQKKITYILNNARKTFWVFLRFFFKIEICLY